MKAVITSGGKGMRMRPLTSVLPKALLPLFRREEGKIVMVPVIEGVMESLSSAGASNFCVVVGQSGKVLRGYFTNRNIAFASQEIPNGFGDAVLKAEAFVEDAPFFVHADDGVLTGGYKEALGLFEEKDADGVLFLRRVDNPKRYGISTGIPEASRGRNEVLRLIDVEEKPEEPKSNLAMIAAYIFKPVIFGALKRMQRKTGEVELTGGIAQMIKEGCKVYGMVFDKERWLNVGDPENYYKALMHTYESAKRL